MTSLNLANNNIGAEGASHLAEGVKGHVSALRFNWCNFELDLTSGSIANQGDDDESTYRQQQYPC